MKRAFVVWQPGQYALSLMWLPNQRSERVGGPIQEKTVMPQFVGRD